MIPARLVLKVTAVLALATSLPLAAGPSWANDWGYDGDYNAHGAPGLPPAVPQQNVRKAPRPARTNRPTGLPFSDSGLGPPPEELQRGLPGISPKPTEGTESNDLPWSEPAEQLQANPAASLNSQPSRTEQSSRRVNLDTLEPAVRDWLNLYGLVTQIPSGGQLPEAPNFSDRLTESQKQRYVESLSKLLWAGGSADIMSISKYWTNLTQAMEDPEQRGNYRLLFRALLSLRADSPDVSAEEKGMILEALGPKRIAEPGPPPLTEDAIEAYTDMSCFLYEFAHPGKSVDAADNRDLYQLMVRDKFKNAPTDRDRMAMNNFPLSWAKFRILYTDASEEQKKLMAVKIASPEGLKGMGIRNLLLEEVLSTPTWKRFVLGQNSTARGTGTSGGARPAGTTPGVVGASAKAGSLQPRTKSGTRVK